MPTTIDLPPVPGSTLPSVTITDNLTGTANSATGSVAYSLVFTDAVTGLEVNDFTVTNGTVSTVTGSGTTWVVNVTPATGVASGTIGFTLKASAVVDVGGVANASAVNSSQAIDTLAPSASSFNPIADAASVAVGSNIVVNFSEAIQSGIGNIVLKTTSGATLATYAPGSSNLSIAGNALTINPTADLAFASGYKVELAANSIKDLAGNNYAGITSYGFTTAAFVNTLPSGSVTITGTASRDQTLTASNTLADVDGLGPITYQWKANGSNIAGATANTYKLTQSEVGKTITVSASYTDAMGTAESVNSTATSAVTAFNTSPTGGVTLTGTPTQGQTLTTTSTLADADGLGTFSYVWKANGDAIAGATLAAFTLTESQVGKTISVTVSYTDGHGTLEASTSPATLAVANLNDLPTGGVTISGTLTQGQTLTAANTLADLDGLGTISYQWKASGSNIASATASTYKLTQSDVGKTITVTASYTDGHGTAEVVSSLASSLVTSTPAQAINGTATNDTLTGSSGNDAIDGKAGTDTAVYTSRMAAYTTSSTTVNGPDGIDTLTSIERLQFADANLAFDLDGNAGQTYRLYQASFNRTPDLSGLGGWIAAMDGGTTPVQVATSFMASAEFQSLYGSSTTNAQFVSLLYTNALHRSADSGGLAGWVDELASGRQTRAQVLVNFSESAENKASVLPAITNGIVYATTAQAAGPANGQSFTATSGNDNLTGTVSNDTFTGGTGNDTITGGGGLDTSVYSGNRGTYTTSNTNGSLTVSGGVDGTDTLTQVERLKFDDAILAFDTSGNAGQTYRLYQAAFNRTPDKAGLTGWVKGVDSGMPMLAVAAEFIKSAEFQTLYGTSTTDSAFVNLLYTNALHRAPDTEGLNYWVNQLSSQSQTREQALLGFSESPENQAALIGVIQNGIELAVG